MKKLEIGMVAACAGLALSAAARGQLINESFDSTSVGGLPTNWSEGTNAGGAMVPWAVVNDQANSAPNSVFTNDPSTVSDRYLQLPTVTSMGQVTLDLWSRFATENTFDGWIVEASINGGAYDNIGQGAWSLNGYNVTISSNFQSPIGGQRAFSGSATTWTERTAQIITNVGDMVSLRIRMASDSSVASTGVWIDDVTVTTGPRPPSGACCLTTSCQIATQASCAGQGGIYLGDNSSCGSCPQPWQEQGDAGDLPASAQVVSGSGGLPGIVGTLDPSDTDMYEIQICNAATFSATTGNTGTTFDTMLWLFDSTGHGIVANDDAVGLQSTITAQFVPGNGLYYLAVSQYRRIPQDDQGQDIWMSFTPEMRPNGAGAANPVAAWNTITGSGGAYTIVLSGCCFVGGNPPPSCYPNCDQSTQVPFLNVNDFICFQTKFAAGDSYANCDGSTQPPVLNVNDFICFQTQFAAGCSAP